MRWRGVAAACMAAALWHAGGAAAQSRGELLYGTHCIACHTTQVHWRDARRAKDWASLKEWVRHWQASERLQWSDEDIVEVARHLNQTLYRFAMPAEPRAAAPPSGGIATTAAPAGAAASPPR